MHKQGIWSKEEHDCFLEAIKMYPQGPWRVISKYIGTRSVRQVQTHAQKYHEKIQRRMHGNRKDRKTWARIEHRIDQDLLDTCRISEGLGLPMSSVLLKVPEHTEAAFSFEQLMDQTSASPSHVTQIPAAFIDEPFIKLEAPNQLFNSAPDDDAISLPSFSESLDFLIEYYSD